MKTPTRIRNLILVGSIAALFSAPAAEAATYTWSKSVTLAGSSDNWSTGTNWSAVPVSAADTTLVFGYTWTTNSTAATNTLTNDVANPFLLNALTLGNANPTAGSGTSIGLINIAGSPLELVSNGGTTPQVNLSQNRSAGQVVTFDVQSNVVLTNNTHFAGAGTANFIISGAISGGGAFTKSGTSILTLTNASNSFNGDITISGGALSIGLAAHLGAASSALVLDGGGLQITGTSITSFEGAGNLGRTVTINSNKSLGLDINNAGNTFIADKALSLGTGGLIKAGAGILQLNQVNTYTGPTAISAGTLSITESGSLGSGNYAGAIGNAGTLIYSSSANQTLSGVISGTGALTKNTNTSTLTLSAANIFSGLTTVTTGTLALTNALALQNSALVTTNGTTTYSGGAALTVGGLSGSRDLGSTDVLNGYTGTVTSLTLNPQTGVSVTYSGIISNGSGAMPLTKTGAGTQTLTGANTYTGATIVKAGTLALGVGGSLDSSSALQIGGGTFNYGNTSASQTLNGLTVNAGHSTVNNTAVGQTLALNAITRTASGYGTVNFATITGAISTTTANTNGIIGPWATTGSTTSLRYAVGSPDGSTPTDIAALTGTTATAGTLADVTDATGNFEYSAAATTSADLTANTLRYSGAAAITAIGASNTITLNGLMQAGSGILTISGGPSTGGILIGSTGELVIAANTAGTTISAAIGGTGRLVYNGAGGRLLLNSTTSSYSGGTVINSGQVAIASDNALGNVSGSITLNGGTLIGNSTNPQAGNGGGVNITSSRDVIVGPAGGTLGAHGNNFFSTTGVLSGSGRLTKLALGGGGGQTLTFSNAANTFTGDIFLDSNNTAGGTINFASLGDTTDAGNLIVGSGAATTNIFSYSGTANLTLFNRAIQTDGSTMTLRTSSTGSLTIKKDLVANGTASRTFTLEAAANTNNVFEGSIGNSAVGGIITVSKIGTGTWTLSGNNTHSGGTSVTAGTLNINSATALGTGTFTIGAATFNNTSGSAITNANNNAIAWNGDGTFSASNDLNLGSGNVTLGGNRTITITNNPGVLTFGGNISGGFNITKGGGGTMAFTATNSSYTGATTVSQGTLNIMSIADYGTNSSIGAPATGNIQIGSTTLTGILNYLGDGDDSNRTIAIGSNTAGNAGGAIINSNGTGALVFDAATFNSGLPSVNTTRNLTLGGDNLQANEIQGVIQNNAALGLVNLVKADAGTWELSGANTYTGTTTINAGTLLVSGSLSGSSAVTVNSSGTLGGSGDGITTGLIGGATTVLDGGKLSPGTSPGTLTFGSTLDISAVNTAGSLLFELGTSSDLVLLSSGALNIGSGTLGFSEFSFSNSGGLAAGTYTLFDTTTDIVGALDLSDLTGTFGAFTGTLGFANGANGMDDIVLTVVPEPSSLALLGIGALGLLRRRRR